MTTRMEWHGAALLFLAALAPPSAWSALIDVSDLTITAFSSYRTQGQAPQNASDVKLAPRDSPIKAETLIPANGIPFPNVPATPSTAFASAAGDALGNFGVGANGFFFRNALPPHALEASVTISQTIANNSGVSVGVSAEIFIPPPTFQFFGIGTAFPGGVDPARDANAVVNARILTTLTRADGTVVKDVPFDYGMTLFREPVTGVVVAIPTIDAEDEISRFEEPDGAFGFQLDFRLLEDFSIGEIGPGETLAFTYAFFAFASTGFGETGVLALIGDPFDLTVGGGRIDIEVVGAPIPEPATWVLLAAGLWVVGMVGQRRAWSDLVQRFQ